MSTTDKTASAGRRDDAELLNQIDQVVRPGADVEPDSLEARLRLLLPGHTYFQRDEQDVPPIISQLADRLGARIAGSVSAGVSTVVKAVWSTPTGVWMVKGHTHGEHATYHFMVDGPDTEVARDGLTVDQVVDLMQAVGAIPRSS